MYNRMDDHSLFYAQKTQQNRCQIMSIGWSTTNVGRKRGKDLYNCVHGTEIFCQ